MTRIGMTVVVALALAGWIQGCIVDWEQYERLPGVGGDGAMAAGGSGGEPTGGTGGMADGGGGTGGVGGLDDHAFRRLLTLAMPAETLTDFVVLVALDATRIDYAQTQDGGQDLRFVTADGMTLLSHEIELWDEAGRSAVWVKIPSYAAGTTLWMYYGDPDAADAQDAAAVWSNGYAAVWHMGGAVLDSTANANHGTVAGSEVAPGLIGQGQLFAQVQDRVMVAATPSLANVFAQGGTMLGLVFATASGTGSASSRIADKSLDAMANGGWSFHISTGGQLGHELGWTTGSWDWHAPAALPLNVWQLVGAVNDTTAAPYVLYQNATAVGQAPTNMGTGMADLDDAQALAIGNHPVTFDRTFAGIIDELRIARLPRSAAWMAAEFGSMTDTLVTYGPEEAAP